MKHKLKLSFWALGILVLVFSQLLVLAPKASAQNLTIDSIRDKTHAYAVYTVWHRCLSNYNGSRLNSLGVSGGTHILGFARSDGDNNDGTISCANAGTLWQSLAGYSDADAMMKDLGFTATKSTCQVSGVNCQDAGVTYYELASGTTASSLPGKLESLAKSKGIATSLTTWGRYILSATALEAKCQPSVTSGPAQRTNPTASVSIVSDDLGTLVSNSYDISTSETVPAYPNMSGGNNASCQYLVNDVKASATKFSAALTEDRISTTISLAETAICEKLNITNDREKQNCLSNFGSYLKTCIDDYYTGNLTSGNRSKTEPFDNDNVASCVATKAQKAGYDIKSEDIVSILSDAQNQATPDTSGTATDTNTDPCAVLGNEIPMRWLACAILTAGSGMATTFYNMVQQLLYMPASSVFNDNFTKTAQSFRIIGMALIIIAGLVMIIAQATGSDLVDAYTIKKVLPKLGIALVGMAVALPLLKFAIQLTNDLGIAAGDVIVRLGGAQATGDSATIGDNIGGIFVGLAGVAVAGVVWGWAALTFIGTAALALLIGVIVLAIRQMALVVLVLIAPLAIAASVLPGTDKLWKFWRGTLLSTLMMFPIIMMFLKSGEFMAGIFSEMAADQNNGLFTVLAAIIYFAPYFMIPLAFKMAGGLISTVFGMMNDRGKGMFDRMSKFRSGYGQTHRERTSGRQMLLAQAGMQRKLKDAAGTSRSRFGRAILGGMAHTVGGYNLEARMSQRQAAVAKEINDQIATGADGEIRGLTVDKAHALRQGEGVGWRRSASGGREFQTLGGAWVSEAEVDAGQRRWGKDHFAQQAALSYEMRKAMTDEQIDHLRTNYKHVAKGSWGMTDTEASGAWTGAKFENQNQHLNLKGSNWDGSLINDGNGNFAYVDEVYEKKGSSAMGQMSAKAISDLQLAYDDGNDATKEKVRAIAETFMQRSSAMGGMRPDPDNPGQVIPGPAQPAVQGQAPQGQAADTEYYRTATWGAAHVAEEVRKLAVHVGVYAPQDPATNSTSVTAGTTNGPAGTYTGTRQS